MAFINQATTLNVKSELDIFTTLPIQTTVESGAFQSYRPITSLSNGGPLEFVVSGSSDEYMDLGRVFIHVKVKIISPAVPPAVDGVNQNAPIVGPTNNWLHSMFSQVDIYLNQKCITPPNNCYNYRAYIENLLNYSYEAKKSHLTTGLWYDDTAGYMDSTAETNTGFRKRREVTVDDKTVDLYGPLHCDIFNVDRYMINGVEMTIKLQRAKPIFHIIADRDVDVKFDIIDAELYVRKVKINPSTLLAHNKALSVATAKYPITRVDVKTITIPIGTQSRILDNVYIGSLPKRCVIGFVSTNAFNGSWRTNPYNFQHFNYTHLGVYLDSVPIPSKPFVCDFPNGEYIRAYNSLFEGCNINHFDIGNNITRSDYPIGYGLIAVDLTPDLNSSATHISFPKTGSLRIDVHFATGLTESVTAIIFSEFDGLIEVDKNRSIVTDYSS